MNQPSAPKSFQIVIIAILVFIGGYYLGFHRNSQQLSAVQQQTIQPSVSPSVDPWKEGVLTGYQLQKGLITQDQATLPNGNNPVVGVIEHGYYTGVLMACAEGHTSTRCQEANDYAKQYGLYLELQ